MSNEDNKQFQRTVNSLMSSGRQQPVPAEPIGGSFGGLKEISKIVRPNLNARK